MRLFHQKVFDDLYYFHIVETLLFLFDFQKVEIKVTITYSSFTVLYRYITAKSLSITFYLREIENVV